MLKRFLYTSLFLISIVSILGCATESETSENTSASNIYQEQGLAIKGYDPVAYFEKSMPVMGKPEFSHTWQNATWQFSNAEYLNEFKASPEKYAPQYGGYCAMGVAAADKLLPGDPAAWKIVEGKLYLNSDSKIQEAWLKDVPNHIATADQKWPTLKPKS